MELAESFNMDDIVMKLPERIVRTLEDFGESQDDWKLKLANEITRVVQNYLPHCYRRKMSHIHPRYPGWSISTLCCCSVLQLSKLHLANMIVPISKRFSIVMYIANWRRASSTLSRDTCTVTSLGGGPGTDLFCILAARWQIFDTPPSKFIFDIFDCAIEWVSTLCSLLGDAQALGLEFNYFKIDLRPPVRSHQSKAAIDARNDNALNALVMTISLQADSPGRRH